MWGALLIGYPFAMWLPRKARLIEHTSLGRFLNNFTNFSISHIAMWFSFYVALILHPYPGTPSQHSDHHNTTWVILLLHCFASWVCGTSQQHIIIACWLSSINCTPS